MKVEDSDYLFDYLVWMMAFSPEHAKAVKQLMVQSRINAETTARECAVKGPFLKILCQ